VEERGLLDGGFILDAAEIGAHGVAGPDVVEDCMACSFENGSPTDEGVGATDGLGKGGGEIGALEGESCKDRAGEATLGLAEKPSARARLLRWRRPSV